LDFEEFGYKTTSALVYTSFVNMFCSRDCIGSDLASFLSFI